MKNHPQVFARFCEDLGLDFEQGHRLNRLANLAAKEQERSCNEENVPTPMTDVLQSFAESVNVGIIWPGIYPVFTKGGRTINLPE